MNRIHQYLFASVAVLLALSSTATEVDQINQRINKPELMKTSFVQNNHIEALQEPLTSKGEVFVDRQSGVAWYVTEPLASKLLITEQGIDEGSGLISASRTVAQLLRAIITGEFNGLSELFALTAQIDADGWELELDPIDQALRSRISSIKLNGSDWIHHLEVVQPMGNRIVIVFDKPEILAVLPSWVYDDLQTNSN